MIQFTNPIWLWGFTSLLVPLGIHLLSRKEGKTIYIGSIRHLRDSNTAQFSSVRLNEKVLLALRCLLLTLIVLLLAGTQLSVGNLKKVKWLVIEKGVEKEQTIKPLIDSLQQQGYEPRYLASGFPALKDSVTLTQTTNYWNLIQHLPNRVDEAVVVSFSYVRRFKGQRLARPERIRWITIEPGSATSIAKAVALSNDSTWLREATTTAENTRLETKIVASLVSTDATAIENRDSVTIAIFSEEEFDYDKKVLIASLQAIGEIIPYKLVVTSHPLNRVNTVESDWAFWLSEKTSVIKSGSSIGYVQCMVNLPLLVPGTDAAINCDATHTFNWVITKRLDEGLALKDHLSISLAAIMLKNHHVPLSVDQDKRVLPENLMWSSAKDNTAPEEKRSPASSDHYILMALLLILGLERLVAYKRVQ